MTQGDSSPKTVIVLGAGASAADGAPVQKDLFRDYFRLYQEACPLPTGTRRDVQLADYFQFCWGINVDHDSLEHAAFPTFEEALGLLEIADSRGEFFRGFGGLGPEASWGRELRSHLISLIAVYLDKKLRASGNYHGALVQQLRTKGDIEQTAFISLNYDILIDNALLMQGATGVNYGVRFDNQNNPRRSRAIWLLKLHGSPNWLFCPTCSALDFYHGQKVAAAAVDDPSISVCERCKGPRVPVMIPPTFFKVMSNFYLQQIWKKAEAKLKEAERIVFCGYSFPDADIHFKYLLKRGEVNRPVPVPAAPEVFIANRPQDVPVAKYSSNDERTRYERFFRAKDRVHWTNLSFQEFAANPDLITQESRWVR